MRQLVPFDPMVDFVARRFHAFSMSHKSPHGAAYRADRWEDSHPLHRSIMVMWALGSLGKTPMSADGFKLDPRYYEQQFMEAPA